MEFTCPKCSTTNKPGSTVCFKCGTALTSQPAAQPAVEKAASITPAAVAAAKPAAQPAAQPAAAQPATAAAAKPAWTPDLTKVTDTLKANGANIGKVLLIVIAVYVLMNFNWSGVNPAIGGMVKSINATDTSAWYPNQAAIMDIGSGKWIDTSVFEAFGNNIATAIGLATMVLFIGVIMYLNSFSDASKNWSGPDGTAMLGHVIAIIAIGMPTDMMKAVTLGIALETLYREKDTRVPAKQYLLIIASVWMALYLINSNYLLLPTQGNILLAVVRFVLWGLFTGASWGWLFSVGILAVYVYRIIKDFKRDGTGLQGVVMMYVGISFVSGQIVLTPITGQFVWPTEGINQVLASSYTMVLYLMVMAGLWIGFEELVKAKQPQQNPQTGETKLVTVASNQKVFIGLASAIATGWITGMTITTYSLEKYYYVPVAIAIWLFIINLKAAAILGPQYAIPQVKAMMEQMVNNTLGDHAVYSAPPAHILVDNDQIAFVLNLIVFLSMSFKPIAIFLGLG